MQVAFGGNMFLRKLIIFCKQTSNALVDNEIMH